MSKDRTDSSSPGELGKKNQDKSSGYLIIIILLIAGTGAAGYYFWAELNSAKSALKRLSDETSMSSASSEKTISNLENTIAQLSTDQELLTEKLSDLYQQQPMANEDWALAEVEYLLVIATHHLVLDRDTRTALTAMEAAYQRLIDLDNTQLAPLRGQLKKDIDELRTVNVVDISGLSVYLADLIDRTDTLLLKKNVISRVKTESADMQDENTGWKNFPGLIWDEIKKLVVIRHNVNQSKPLLLPEEEYFLYQNLRLELENARLAVLLADNDNLQVSINMLTEWLNRYFDSGDAGVASILETLEHMKTVDLGPELPDISSSLESLRAFTHSAENSRHDVESTAGEPAL